MDGTCAHMPEMPERASWDLRPAQWSSGSMVVNFPSRPDTEVVCFAPPGASLYGENGLAVASWRRGVWSTEAEFVARRCPDSIDELDVTEATQSIPSDFTRWAQRETASHVEMLRAFAQRRPHRVELKAAATRLYEELEAFEPGALEHCRVEADVLAARTDFLERRARERDSEVAVPTPISWGNLRRFPVQAALLGALYGLYRFVRPDGPAGDLQTLDQLSPGAILDVLMWIYGNAHVVVAFTFLTWVLFRRHSAFDFVRNAIIAAAVVTVIPYLLLASGGAYGPDASHDVPSSAIPTMPALHLCIAIIVGCWGVLLARGPLARLVWLGYPCLTLAVVVASNPSDLTISIAGGFVAAIIGFLVAMLAGHLHRSWRPPQMPELRLPRLPTITHF